MKTLFHSHFVRDLRKTKDQALIKWVETAIEEIKAARTFADISDLKKLKGYPHCYRIRVGNYRIGVYCEGDEVQLMRLLHRKDIYRKFPES